MVVRRWHGFTGLVVTLALGATLVGASGAQAAEVKVTLPQDLEATTGFPVTIPVKVRGDRGLVLLDWGNGETFETYTNQCTFSSRNPTLVCTGSESHTYYSPGSYTVTATVVDPQNSEDGERATTPLHSAQTVVEVTGPPVPEPFNAWRLADVEISALPELATAPASFTVTASRTDGVAACSATFGETKLDGPGPWQFTYEPAADDHDVTVNFCDGGYANEYLKTRPLFRLSGPELVNLTGEWSGTKQDARWTAASAATVDATVEILRKGKVIDSVALPAGGSAELKESFKAKNFPTGSTELMIRATGSDGSVMQWPVTLAKGWSGFGSDINPTFTPCSTVTWSYSNKGAPKSTSKMRKTSRQAFALLGKKTGLNFVEAKPGDATADVRITWGDLRHRGSNIAGTGGTDGSITLSDSSFWPRDPYAGLTKNASRGVPGNGWLVLHEALHVLGLGHTDTHGELMSSRSYRDRAGFGKGDRAAIDALYRPSTCG